jgi:hypothetical protein
MPSLVHKNLDTQYIFRTCSDMLQGSNVVKKVLLNQNTCVWHCDFLHLKTFAYQFSVIFAAIGYDSSLHHHLQHHVTH